MKDQARGGFGDPAQLEQCRRMALAIGDAQTKAILEAWALELEQELAALGGDGTAAVPPVVST
jgi:hypothetical protein